MRTTYFLSALVVGALSAGGCSSKDRPTPIPFDADFPDGQPIDTPVTQPDAPSESGVDGGTLDAGDSTVTDALTPDVPPSDTPFTDAPRDVAPDVFMSPLCGFTESQINRLAVRIAGCTGEAAQTVLTRFWRPETWEGNGVHARDCLALRCAASATDCTTAMFDCLKYGVNPVGDAGTCSPMPMCDGRILTRCDGVRRYADDCEATARTCVATSTEATCAPRGATACAAGAAPRCSGDDYQQCIAGQYVTVQRCGATQSGCDAAAGGCVGREASCTGSDAACNGTSVSLCRNGHAQTMPCGDLVAGANCRAVAGHAFCGAAADCDPTTAAPGGRCDGNNLLLCAGGRTFTYDCRAEGFSGCGGLGCTR